MAGQYSCSFARRLCLSFALLAVQLLCVLSKPTARDASSSSILAESSRIVPDYVTRYGTGNPSQLFLSSVFSFLPAESCMLLLRLERLETNLPSLNQRRSSGYTRMIRFDRPTCSNTSATQPPPPTKAPSPTCQSSTSTTSPFSTMSIQEVGELP